MIPVSGNARVRVVLMLLLAVCALCFLAPSARLHAQDGASALTETLDPALVVEWMQLMRQRIQAERFNPPAAARAYGYAGITIYESLYPGMPNNRSLAFQVNGLDALPDWESGVVYDWLSVSNAALHTVLTGLFEGHSDESFAQFDALRNEQADARTEAVGADVVQESLTYGDELGAALLEWIADDRYDRARAEGADYVMATAEELGLTPETDYMYVRTNEEMPLVEPKFGLVRTLGVENRYTCIVPDNMRFSIDEESAYYQQAREVFGTINDLTREQREIAEFWIDTPGVSSTPAGHWISIANQMVDHLDLTLDRAAMVYGMLGMVLHDSFVVGFGIKYESPTMRPQTYIQRHISPRWTSYLVTPQFPEYPSNHSIVSAAASDILTSLLGIVPFTDYTAEESLGYVRSFFSFEQAADEAAISRIYGGIHYRTAVENGKRIGRCIAAETLDNVTMLPIEQGE